MNVKKIIIAISIIVAIIASVAITNYVNKRQSNKLIEQLNTRYSALESSNRQLQETNNDLIITNNRIRDELENSNRFIESARNTIEELETGITESTNIIDRIEKTARAMQEIIINLPDEDIILENDNNN